MNKKGKVGVLTTIFIFIILAPMVFMSMWFFYADIVETYGDVLNHTIDEDFEFLYNYSQETLDFAAADSKNMSQEYEAFGGTETTGEDSMILNSFKTVKSIMSSTFSLMSHISSEASVRLHIPKFWLNGAIAILLIVILIVVIAGFLRTSNW